MGPGITRAAHIPPHFFEAVPARLPASAARVFAEAEGAHIGLLARGMEALESAKRKVEELGGKAIILQCDAIANKRRAGRAALCHPEPAQRGEGSYRRFPTSSGKVAPDHACEIPRRLRGSG